MIEFFKNLQPKTYLFTLLFLALAVFVILARVNDDGSDFVPTSAESTTTTLPASSPNLDQPCSLIPVQEAITILDTNSESLDPLSSTQVGDETLRCRFSALTSDKSHYKNFNVFVYKSESDFDRLTDLNATGDIDGGEGFTLERQTDRDFERLLAVQKNDIRIGISSTLAQTRPGEKIDLDQYQVLTFDELARIIQSIFEKIA